MFTSFSLFIRSLFDRTWSNECCRELAYSPCSCNRDNLTCEERQLLQMDDEVLDSRDSLAVDRSDRGV